MQKHHIFCGHYHTFRVYFIVYTGHWPVENSNNIQMVIVLLEESGVKLRLFSLAAAVMVCLLALTPHARAQETIQTTVVMRVSHMTRNAVVDAGEDLSIEVSIEGVTPESYQWYFEGTPIEGATQKVLNIVNAQTSDAGIYRMDAFDESGAMVVSMDIAVRVVEKAVPQAGDSSLPVGFAWGGMALCAAAMALLLRRRASV